MNAVDTNAYVYASDANEPAKQTKALELLDRLALKPAETVIAWQVAGEFLGQLRKWESTELPRNVRAFLRLWGRTIGPEPPGQRVQGLRRQRSSYLFCR
jgi:predicted nucleic acid-binding protein